MFAVQTLPCCCHEPYCQCSSHDLPLFLHGWKWWQYKSTHHLQISSCIKHKKTSLYYSYCMSFKYRITFHNISLGFNMTFSHLCQWDQHCNNFKDKMIIKEYINLSHSLTNMVWQSSELRFSGLRPGAPAMAAESPVPMKSAPSNPFNSPLKEVFLGVSLVDASRDQKIELHRSLSESSTSRWTPARCTSKDSTC